MTLKRFKETAVKKIREPIYKNTLRIQDISIVTTYRTSTALKIYHRRYNMLMKKSDL